MPKRDYRSEPFTTMVVMGESTVQGGPWLPRPEERWADVLARLIDACQETPLRYLNKGIGANAISPRSPGYASSAKPSALERYRADVIENNPDLFLLCYGLNDMRAGMNVEEFRDDVQTILRAVRDATGALTVLTTVYYMTGWRSFPPYDKGSVDLAKRYNELLRRLAAGNDCLLADVWDAEGGADWLLHPDGVHANVVGNRLIAHKLFEVLAANCSALTLQAHQRDAGTDWTKRTTTLRAEAGDPFRKTW